MGIYAANDAETCGHPDKIDTIKSQTNSQHTPSKTEKMKNKKTTTQTTQAHYT